MKWYKSRKVPTDEPPSYDNDAAQKKQVKTEEWAPVSQDQLQGMKDHDQNLKKTLRILRFVVRLATLGLAIFTLYTQAFTLNKFLTTRGIIRDGRNPWANDSSIWPTILLLVTSSVSIAISLVTLVGYLWSVKHANRASSKIGNPASVFELAAHMAVWIGTAVAYRVGKTGSDLWGWSCSTKANDIQSTFEEVNFAEFCQIQGEAFNASIAQAVLFIITCAVWFIAWSRSKHQQQIKYHEDQYESVQG